MTDLFTVRGAQATPLTPVNLRDAGLQERAHLQEWGVGDPQNRGVGLHGGTTAYDRWTGSGGAKARERLDILGLDSAGRLVVVELKRDDAPTDTHLQAITYAALVSRFTLETLADAHAAWLTHRGTPTDSDDARTRLLEHADELDPDLLRRPRIVLLAGSFPRQVTHTAVWLSEMGLDIELIEVTAWRHGDSVLAGFNRRWPTPELEEFTLSPARAIAEQVTQKVEQRTRAANAVRRLVDAGTLPDGAELRLTPQHGSTASQRVAIEAWVAEDPDRGRATWRNDASAPLTWAVDGSHWLPTTLARRILLEGADTTVESLRGTAWWSDEQGRSLAEIADSVPGKTGRDWSDLHTALDAIPPGYWTTYGDLAQLVGTGAQALGQHIAKCPQCANAHRVLNTDGRVSPGFQWSDPSRTEKPQDLLAEEGVPLVDGVADQSRRLGPQQLAEAIRALG
jgi:alkylated DNA nucleotide flippase Atl1/glutathione S-transferase